MLRGLIDKAASMIKTKRRRRRIRTIGSSFAVFYAEISAYIGMYNRVTGDVRVAALNKAANNATDMSHPEARCRVPMPKSVITSSPRWWQMSVDPYISTIPGSHLFYEGRNIGDHSSRFSDGKPLCVALTVMARRRIERFVFDSLEFRFRLRDKNFQKYSHWEFWNIFDYWNINWKIGKLSFDDNSSVSFEF